MPKAAFPVLPPIGLRLGVRLSKLLPFQPGNRRVRLRKKLLLSRQHSIIGPGHFLPLAPQSAGDGVNPPMILLARRPSGGGQVNPPGGITAGRKVARHGRALLKIVLQRFSLMPFRSLPGCFQNPPPGDVTAVPAQHRAHLPGATGSKKLGDVAVGHCGPGGNQPDNGQYRLHKINPH